MTTLKTVLYEFPVLHSLGECGGVNIRKRLSEFLMRVF